LDEIVNDFQPIVWPVLKLRKITAAIIRPFSTMEPDDSSAGGHEYYPMRSESIYNELS